MKRTFQLLILIAVALKANSQENVKDSIKRYEKQLAQLRKDNLDSLQKTSKYKSILEKVNSLKQKSDSYGAIFIYGTLNSADYNAFNLQNSSSGFSNLSNQIIGFGYGFSSKKNCILFDFNITAFGLNKKSKNATEEIRTSSSSFLQLEFGYDFVKSNKFNVYPYAGIGYRTSLLNYKSVVSTNSTFPNLTGIITNNKSFNETASEFGYQLGLGMEFVITKDSKQSGTILFFKGGTNRAFSRKSFNIEGVKYDPQFNYGNFISSIGFKFFSR